MRMVLRRCQSASCRAAAAPDPPPPPCAAESARPPVSTTASGAGRRRRVRAALQDEGRGIQAHMNTCATHAARRRECSTHATPSALAPRRFLQATACRAPESLPCCHRRHWRAPAPARAASRPRVHLRPSAPLPPAAAPRRCRAGCASGWLLRRFGRGSGRPRRNPARRSRRPRWGPIPAKV